MKNINTFIAENNSTNVTYVTNFKLAIDVPVADANDYLQEDNMVDYLKNDIDKTTIKPNELVSLTWKVNGVRYSDHGTITLVTTRDFTEKELDFVSEWVRGQNSDGLGEGFEQTFEVENSYNTYDYNADDDGDGYCDSEMASFDWKTNKYKFVKK